MHRALILASLLASLIVAAPAHAEPLNELRFDVLGLSALTVGPALSYDRTVAPHIRLEASMGVGLMPGTAINALGGLGARFDFGTEGDHFIPGVALVAALALSGTERGLPLWLDVDLIGYEHRFASGLVLMGSLGVSVGLGGGSYCIDCSGSDDYGTVAGIVVPQGRIGIGKAF